MKSIPVESRLPGAKEILLPPTELSPDPMPVERLDHFPPIGSLTAGRLTVSRWTLTKDERAAVLCGRDILVVVLLPEDERHPPLSLSVSAGPGL